MKKLKKNIRNYFNKQKSNLSDFSGDNNFIPSEKNVHELRVAIKKLRILFLLCEKMSERKFNAKKFKDKLDPLFKAAGKVRECQVNIERIGKYNSLRKSVAEYENFLRKKELELKKTLRKRLKKFDRDILDAGGKEFKKNIRVQTNKKSAAAIRKFILSERKKAIRLIKAGMTQSEKFHDSRKHLKAIHITAALLSDTKQNPGLEKLQQDTVATEELIGSWHDNEMLYDSFRNYINDTRLKKGFNQAMFTKIENEITGKSKSLLQDIKTKLKNPETSIAEL